MVIDGLVRIRTFDRIEPVAPLRGRPLPDGSILAPRVSFEESMALYPADT